MSFQEHHKALEAKQASIDANRAYRDKKSEETDAKYNEAATKYHLLFTKYKESVAAGNRDSSEVGVRPLLVRCCDCGQKGTVSVQEQKKMWENYNFLWYCDPCDQWAIENQDNSE